jgi:membrane protein
VLLMWIFFSSAILLYSAGCAKAVEELRREHNAPLQAPGKGRRPRSGLQVR